MRRHRFLFLLVVGAMLATLTSLSPASGVSAALPRVVSADPVNNTPHALNGKVLAIAEVGNTVYVGGTFTTVRNATSTAQISRSRLFAYNRSTGQILTGFNPRPDGNVESIAPGPNNTIIIGGRFRNVASGAQRSLAMLDANGRRVTGFSARTNGIVNKVVVRGNRLIAAGRFGTAGSSNGNVTRTNLAGFNATTGVVDGLNVPVTVGRTKSGAATTASVTEMDANPAGTALVIVGNFRQVAGQLRQQIAMVNLTSNGGSLAAWSTSRFPNDVARTTNAYQCYDVFDTAMRDVEFSPDGSYFAVVTTGGAGDLNRVSLCDTVSRWEMNPSAANTRETWRNCTGGDTLLSVAVTGAAIYVGGHQRWLDNCGGRDAQTPGAWPHNPEDDNDTNFGIGAVSTSTGLAIRTWNPGRTRGVGAEELVATGSGLYIGSDTERLGRDGTEFHGRFGLFPAG